MPQPVTRLGGPAQNATGVAKAFASHDRAPRSCVDPARRTQINPICTMTGPPELDPAAAHNDSSLFVVSRGASLSGVTTFAVSIGIWLMAAPEFDKGTLARTLIGPCGQVTGLPDRRQAYGPSPLVKFLRSERCRASPSDAWALVKSVAEQGVEGGGFAAAVLAGCYPDARADGLAGPPGFAGARRGLGRSGPGS
jgi:hypothetical protein